jgi:integrase/recombinase XerD
LRQWSRCRRRPLHPIPSGSSWSLFCYAERPLILAFLQHLEKKRGNTARTRNARLAAINSFFRFLEYREPSCLDQARRIHAIPMKKTDRALVGYLTREELQALLDAPNGSTVSGIRDRAMLHLAFAAGMRVSELVGLRLDQIDRQGVSTVHIIGKGVASGSCRSGRRRLQP